jgi:xanthine dehydrogenase small subunit
MTEDTFREAGTIARAEVRPISDVRGNADYRLQLVENILCKFYWDAGPPQALQVSGKEAV